MASQHVAFSFNAQNFKCCKFFPFCQRRERGLGTVDLREETEARRGSNAYTPPSFPPPLNNITIIEFGPRNPSDLRIHSAHAPVNVGRDLPGIPRRMWVYEYTTPGHDEEKEKDRLKNIKPAEVSADFDNHKRLGGSHRQQVSSDHADGRREKRGARSSRNHS